MKRSLSALIALFAVVGSTFCDPISAVTPSTDVADAATIIYTHVSERQTHFTVTLPARDESELVSALKDAIAKDDDLREDYHSMQVMSTIHGMSLTATYDVQYWETRAQALYVQKRLKAIVHQITKGDQTQAQKELAIHDYIVLHTAYDTSLTHMTPYDELTTGTTVCQGYAMMAYLMLKDAGIVNHIVDGTANGQPHAWNLVRIDGHWYNLDVTWDDPVPNRPGKVSYAYFNLTNRQLTRDHVWQSNGYPSATTDFVTLLTRHSGMSVSNRRADQSILQHTALYLETPAYTYTSLGQLSEKILAFSGHQMSFRYPSHSLQSDLSLVVSVRSYQATYEADPRNPGYDIVTMTFS